MAGVAVGDALLLGVLLAVVAVDLIAGLGAFLATGSVLVRWGSSSLGALAGDQAVLGGAGWTGSLPAAASSWCAAAALIAATPAGAMAAIGFGLAAASVVAGPGIGGPVLVRVAASAVGVAAAWAASRFGVRTWTRIAAVVGGVLSVALAFAR
jgi:hypothetical protein